MSLRGQINQGITDWRNQRAVLGTTSTSTSPSKPDTTDGVDLLVIILFVWFVCLLAGYVIGKHA